MAEVEKVLKREKDEGKGRGAKNYAQVAAVQRLYRQLLFRLSNDRYYIPPPPDITFFGTNNLDV
jgi:hypothetical protein